METDLVTAPYGIMRSAAIGDFAGISQDSCKRSGKKGAKN
jgi:hypothetical protein